MGLERHEVPEEDEVAHNGLQKREIHQAPQKDRMVFSQQEDNPVEGLPLAADSAPELAR